MLSHTDFNFTIGKIGDGHAVLRMSAGFHCDSQRSQSRIEAFADFNNFIQGFAFFGSCTYNLNQRNTTSQATTVVIRRIQSGTDIIVGQNRLHLDACTFRQLACHVRTHHVTGVIQHNQQNTGFTLEHLQSLEQTLGSRSSEDITNHGTVQHTVAYKTT